MLSCNFKGHKLQTTNLHTPKTISLLPTKTNAIYIIGNLSNDYS
jgi:hypothetical protein